MPGWAVFYEGCLALEGVGVALLAGEKIAAVGGLEGGDVVFGVAEFSEDVEGAGAEALEFMVADGDEKEDGGEHGDGQDADEGRTEQFSVKLVFRLEETAELLVGGKFVGQ